MRIYLSKSRGRLSEENARKGKSKKISLYLVYDYGNGQKRQYEFLKLYLYEKPKTNIEREHNKETMQLAEAPLRQKKFCTLNHHLMGLLAM